MTELSSAKKNQLDSYNSGKYGILNPRISNQVPQSINYYKNRSIGVVYQNLKEESRVIDVFNDWRSNLNSDMA